jgi:molybdate/tungstate transport system substrate-binding protein
MTRKRAVIPLLLLVAGGCSADRQSEPDHLVVFTAGSLARPVRAALDSFAAQNNVRYDLESAGSLETARKLTELNKIPDVIALADEDVFPKLLMPRFTTWYARFARNRLVIAYSDRSRYASELSQATWREVLTRPDVQVGRANPDLDPAGYRTLLAFQLAERHYQQPGLAKRLESNAPPRNMRAKEAELVALVQAGELDYAWQYESLARAVGHRYLVLPSAIDLSTTADSATYATATVPVVGSAPGDTITMRGRPIRYAVSVPITAAHAELGQRFVAWLLSPVGRAALRAEHLDALEVPELSGADVPPLVKLPE